jgi:chloride channel 7
VRAGAAQSPWLTPVSFCVSQGHKQHAQTTYLAKEEYIATPQKGSRAVGGKRPHDKKAYESMESVDYLTPDTRREEHYFRTMTPTDRAYRSTTLWLLYAAIGTAVALVILGTLTITAYIMKKRAYWTKDQLATDDLVGAWLVWTGSSGALCSVALLMVLLEPACASSGIPGLIAFLNGVMPQGGKSPLLGHDTSFISYQTMVAKLVGMVCSIPSGLCVGPEGPIIHISALLGHWTTRLVQYCEHRLLPRYYFTANASEARDFLATGAACGICVAFRAPLAGCLFVVEEAGSFFSTVHLERTFFACVVAYLVANAMANPEDGFVKFKQATGFFCDSNYSEGTDLLLIALLAVLGGTLGAVFNQVVEHLSHLRVHHINRSAWRRALEVLALVLVTGSVAVFLPAAFECQIASRGLMMRDSTGCLSQEDMHQISHGSVDREYLLSMLKLLNATNATAGHRRQLGGGSATTAGAVEVDLEAMANYLNREGWQRRHKEDGDPSWMDATLLDNSGGDGDYVHLHYGHQYNCKDSHSYHGMAMLWLNGGVKGVKVLMQRGFPHMLTAPTLITFCCVYFVLAAFTSGISVPAGLVVPMLLIGGSFGRAVGLLGLEMKRGLCDEFSHLSDADVANSFYWSSVYRWVGRECNLPDPGVFAVIGMAAFLGGSGRITLFLATMMVELTDDASLIAPVGGACMIAMIIGNKFNHGLYHGLIPVFSLPFLNAAPADVMYLSTVSDIMADKVICLPKVTAIERVKKLLDDYESDSEMNHNAFPVVDSMDNQRLRGIIEVDELREALDDAEEGQTIHLYRDYADRSPITVYTHSKVARAFDIFRKLGLRHMCVTDSEGMLKGILTRKSLMTYKLGDETKLKKVESFLRGWVVRWRLEHGRDSVTGAKLDKALATKARAARRLMRGTSAESDWKRAGPALVPPGVGGNAEGSADGGPEAETAARP